MTQFLCAVSFALVMVLVPRAQTVPGNLVDGKVELMPVDDGATFSLGVKVAKGVDADRAVVTIHYLQDSRLGKLWLTRTSVVEVVPDVFVGTDALLLPRSAVQRIEVILVKDVEQHRFEMAEKK